MMTKQLYSVQTEKFNNRETQCENITIFSRDAMYLITFFEVYNIVYLFHNHSVSS